MPAHIKAYLFLIVTTFGWAGNAVIAKFAVGHVGPFTLSGARWTIAFVLIMLISAPQVRRDWPLIRANLPLLLGFGAAGFAGFNAFLYSALQYTSAINCVVEQAGIPGVIFIANFILFRTKVAWAQVLGFSITLLGVVITATHGDLGSILSLDLNFGDGLMMIAVLLYAGYTVALCWKPDIHWKSLMAASALGAMLASAPLALHEFTSPGFIMPDAIGWTAILYTGTIPSLVSQILYVRGVELIGPNRAGLFINAIPAFGTVMSALFLNEPLMTFHIIALCMVLSGIAIAEKGRGK
jgi:drug/metabolite transporter (DMT)-like permease